ncbi:tetratricopeptide repeat protein [Bacteroidota bacterium]
MKMKSVCTTLFLTSLLLFTASITTAQTLDSLIQKGDDVYHQFDNEGALVIFNQANEMYPRNWEVIWRLARTHTDIAEHLPTSTDEQLDAQEARYEKAVDFAETAVYLAPEQSVTYLRRAIAKGRLALFRGVFTGGIGLANDVKADCEKAIALGNGGDDIQAVAHYVYARSHHKVSEKWAPARAVLGLGWADIDIALEEYEKALALDPDLMMIYFDYAQALIEEDEYDKARELLNRALECPQKDEDDAKKVEEINDLLAQIEDE